MSLLIIHEITTHNENEFLRVAHWLATASASEADTLRYQWFKRDTPGAYAIVEEYRDADAAEAHNKHVESLLGELFKVIEIVSSAFFGELNDYVRAWTTGRAGVTLHLPLA